MSLRKSLTVIIMAQLAAMPVLSIAINREQIAYIAAGVTGITALVSGIWAYKLHQKNSLLQEKFDRLLALKAAPEYIEQAEHKYTSLFQFRSNSQAHQSCLQLADLIKNCCKSRNALDKFIKDLQSDMAKTERFETLLQDFDLATVFSDTNLYAEEKKDTVSKLLALREKLISAQELVEKQRNFLELCVYIDELERCYVSEIEWLKDNKDIVESGALWHELIIKTIKNKFPYAGHFSHITYCAGQFPHITYISELQAHVINLQKLIKQTTDENMPSNIHGQATRFIKSAQRIIKFIESTAVYDQEKRLKWQFDMHRSQVAYWQSQAATRQLQQIQFQNNMCHQNRQFVRR